MELWNTLFTFWLKITCSTFFLSTLLKLELALFLHRFLMATILGWFLYFRTAFIIVSFILSKKGLLLKYLVIPRFWTMFGKISFRIYEFSRSPFIRSAFSVKWILFLATTLSDKKGFTIFQRSLLSMIDFSFKFSFLFLILS